MLVDKAEGKDIAVSDEFADVTFQWVLNGELFHGLERPLTIPKIISTLFYSKKDIRFLDPMPNLYQLAYIFVHYYKKLKG